MTPAAWTRELVVAEASTAERDWAAGVMAGSDPWKTLGRGLEHCLLTCHRSDCLMLVGHCDGAPSAFAILHPRGLAGSPYLAAFGVAAEWRGRGVGGRLLEACERHFASSSRHFFLCVSSFNSAARAFYERHGYECVGELRDYVIDGASEFVMHKRLDRR
jgi:ribosomal protein S18 acetylase RimI-like enzyme